MTTKKPTRRPRHAYSPELTDLICERLLDGTSLRQICQDKNMPARSAIIVWLAKHKEFARKYMIARQIQIDCLLGDMLDIADDCSKDWIEREGPDGKKSSPPGKFRRIVDSDEPHTEVHQRCD